MTVIVAARLKKGGIGLAADSLTTAGWEKEYADRTKLWSATPYALGAAGCVRTSQVIRHWTSWPKWRPDEDIDIEAFLVRSIVPAIRSAVKDTDRARPRTGARPPFGAARRAGRGRTRIDIELVLAWGDNLAVVSGNGAVVVPKSGRCAIGSGYAEALGHLGDQGPWSMSQIIEAARRATLTNLGCDGPISYMNTTDLQVEHA